SVVFWYMFSVACVPSSIMVILFDDYFDAYLQTPIVISIMLIFYGLLFILIENWNKKRTPTTMALSDISYKTAILIGAFQDCCFIADVRKCHSSRSTLFIPIFYENE